MKSSIFAIQLLILLLLAGSVRAANYPIRQYTAADSIMAVELINSPEIRQGDADTRLNLFIEKTKGLPYTGGTLEGEREELTVNMHEFDCVTLVQTYLALVKAATRVNPVWRDFTDALVSIRYRKGELDGYPSRTHYTADWISDNVYRGNIKEITADIETPLNTHKTLDYMSTHASQYPALKDSVNLEGVKRIEMGFRNFKIPYLKKEVAAKRSAAQHLRSGDVIVFITRDSGLDASHLGLIKMINGEPYLFHASSSQRKVTLESTPLKDYFKRNGRNLLGFRILRPAD